MPCAVSGVATLELLSPHCGCGWPVSASSHAQGLLAAVSAVVGDVDKPKISLSRFGEGDVALFMPCGKEQVDKHGNALYVAFNVNCPRHFLHPSSLLDFLARDPVSILRCAPSQCLRPICWLLAGALSLAGGASTPLIKAFQSDESMPLALGRGQLAASS